MSKSSNDRPSVLSFQRGLNISDGLMYSLRNTEVEGEYRREPVPVVRHGIRGVLGAENAEENGKNKDSLSNPQVTETAKLPRDSVGLEVGFTLRPIPLEEVMFNCNDAEYIKLFRNADGPGLINAAAGSESLKEVCRRYARNMMNGRWLWRNRVHGRPEISVKFADQHFDYQAATSTKNFEGYTEAELALAEHLRQCLVNEHATDPCVEVVSRIRGRGLGMMEVFPSQNYTSEKPKGYARFLYKVDPVSLYEINRQLKEKGLSYADTIITGLAALRDQKIGNAIRTIDSWYAEDDVPAIPVEPNGACLADGEFHRKSKSGKGEGPTAYYLLNKESVKALTQEMKVNPGEFSQDQAYLIATLIRGGVYGKSGKNGKEE